MPIRLNLFAEAQAAEEIRRRDPAKRAALVAGALVALALTWSASLQMRLFADNSKLGHLERSHSAKTNEYVTVLSNQRKLMEINGKLVALNKMATNRFLQGSMLNALQLTTMEGIQLTRLRMDQNYQLAPEVKPQKVDGRVVPGKPASTTIKTLLTLEARDSTANPGGDSISRFKQTLARNNYFECQHVSTNEILLKNLSAPSVDTESGKACVMFSFECRFPEQVR